MKKFLIKAIKKLETGLNFNIITKIIKSALNKKIQNFGTVKEFSFDDALKQIIVEIELKGDDKPLKIVISKYNISDNNDYFVIREIQINKEWIEEIAKEHILHKRFKIPVKYRDYMNYFK